MTTLGDLVVLQGGGTPARHVAAYWNGRIPWASVKDLSTRRLRTTEESITEAGVSSSATTVIKAGHVVVATRMAVGRAALLEVDTAINQDLKALIPRKGKRVHPNYILHLLAAGTPFLERRATGATVKGIRGEVLESLPVPHADYDEQRRIADILDKADAIRRKRKETIALTEELLRSAFLEMFGDPVTNPKGWPVEPLGKYLGFVTSGSRGWAEHYSDRGARFIRSLDVQMDRIADVDAAYVVPPAGAEAERTRVRQNDVLLTITGSKIGRAARATHEHEGAFISQHVAILRTLSGLDSDVLTAFLVSDRGGQALIARAQYGQSKPGLNLSQIRDFPIAVPPPKVQREIRNVRQQIRTSQERFTECLHNADGLFETLIAREFAGTKST